MFICTYNTQYLILAFWHFVIHIKNHKISFFSDNITSYFQHETRINNAYIVVQSWP